jgi:hypothetical protein
VLALLTEVTLSGDDGFPFAVLEPTRGAAATKTAAKSSSGKATE